MAGTSVVYERGIKQFQGAFSNLWTVTCTLDAANVASKGVGAETVTVPGVALGDMVLGVSLAVDNASVTIWGYVSAANTVTLAISNNTGSGVDLASTTVKLLVARPAW
jgi:hypothetical protein